MNYPQFCADLRDPPPDCDKRAALVDAGWTRDHDAWFEPGTGRMFTLHTAYTRMRASEPDVLSVKQ